MRAGLSRRGQDLLDLAGQPRVAPGVRVAVDGEEVLGLQEGRVQHPEIVASAAADKPPQRLRESIVPAAVAVRVEGDDGYARRQGGRADHVEEELGLFVGIERGGAAARGTDQTAEPGRCECHGVAPREVGRAPSLLRQPLFEGRSR